MSTITTEQQAAIAAKLDGMALPSGLGDEHAACSIAAINLALTGRLTDTIPDCMSPVIGRWIIDAQDAMPDALRNSPRWKGLLPLAAGTGRKHERERLGLILDWMWGTVLPALQPTAGRHGFGAAWQCMTTERTAEAAAAAGEAARGVSWATDAAMWAAKAADVALWPSWAEGQAAAWAAGVAKAAAKAVARAPAVRAAVWDRFDPCWLLERLIAVGEKA